MVGGFTSNKALIAAVTTELTAFVTLLVAAGVHVRPELRDAIVGFVTVSAPALVILYGVLHHGHTKVAAAVAARAPLAQTVSPPATATTPQPPLPPATTP